MKQKFFSLSIVASFVIFAGFKISNKTAKPLASAYPDTTVTKFFKREAGWIASDGGLTVHLNDGKTLWLMGDSHVNDFDLQSGTIPCLFQVRNCVLLQPKGDWQWQDTQTLIGKGPGSKSYFKFNPSDKFFSWPGAGVQLGDSIYVYCSSLQNTGGGGAFGFRSAGNDYWAKIKYPEMTVAGYNRLPDFAGINFGFSIIKNEADGYVYVYGSKLRLIAADIFVARFPVSNPNAAWAFWDGKTWSADVARSAPIGRSPSSSVSFCKVKDKYLMVCSQFSVGCDQGKEIYTATAKSPIGPFNKPKTVYSIPDRNQGHSPFFYSVFGHPEFINAKDELLITYSVNGYGKCVTDCVNGRSDPNVYRPRAIRVPLKLIDPAL